MLPTTLIFLVANFTAYGDTNPSKKVGNRRSKNVASKQAYWPLMLLALLLLLLVILLLYNDDIIAVDISDTVELETPIIIVEINGINTIYKPAEKIMEQNLAKLKSILSASLPPT